MPVFKTIFNNTWHKGPTKRQNPNTYITISEKLAHKMAGSHGSMRSEIILVFLLLNLWIIDWQKHIRIPNTPGVSSMFTCGSQRRISTYNSSLPCKVDFIQMKVKKYFGARIAL